MDKSHKTHVYCFGQYSDMAEGEPLSVGNGQSALVQSVQSDLMAPSAGIHGLLQDGSSYTPLDSNTDRTVQPFPRSPKLQRKAAADAQPSQVNMIELLFLNRVFKLLYIGLVVKPPVKPIEYKSLNYGQKYSLSPCRHLYNIYRNSGLHGWMDRLITKEIPGRLGVATEFFTSCFNKP